MSIPSTAALSTHEISGGAFKLYACYCVHREGFEANVKNEQIRAETGLGYAYISTLKFELLEAGWIGLSNSSKKGIVPLKGFEVPAEQVRAERKLSKIERTSDKKLPNIETSSEKVSKVESPESQPVKVSKTATLLSDEVSKIESFASETFENQKEISGTPLASSKAETTKKDKEPKTQSTAPRKRVAEPGSRLAEEFALTPAMREWALKEAADVDLDLALAEFRDYWRGVPGSRGKKLDWEATWRNRMRELQGRIASRKVARIDERNGRQSQTAGQLRGGQLSPAAHPNPNREWAAKHRV
jgi:hypothetical protein